MDNWTIDRSYEWSFYGSLSSNNLIYAWILFGELMNHFLNWIINFEMNFAPILISMIISSSQFSLELNAKWKICHLLYLWLKNYFVFTLQTYRKYVSKRFMVIVQCDKVSDYFSFIFFIQQSQQRKKKTFKIHMRLWISPEHGEHEKAIKKKFFFFFFIIKAIVGRLMWFNQLIFPCFVFDSADSMTA